MVAALGGRRHLSSVVRRLSTERWSRCEGVYAERGSWAGLVPARDPASKRLRAFGGCLGTKRR